MTNGTILLVVASVALSAAAFSLALARWRAPGSLRRSMATGWAALGVAWLAATAYPLVHYVDIRDRMIGGWDAAYRWLTFAIWVVLHLFGAALLVNAAAMKLVRRRAGGTAPLT